MNCDHPEAAIEPPKRDDLDWYEEGGCPFYVARCRDCGQNVEVHFTEIEVRPL